MTRSGLQSGPAIDHYHTALGVDQTTEGGGVTVIGPFHVVGGDDDLINGVAVATLAEGTVVLDAWAIVTERLTLTDNPAAASIGIGVGTLLDWTDVVARIGESDTPGTPYKQSVLYLTAARKVVVAATDCFLIAYEWSDDGEPSGAGVADIYALVVEPAA